MANLTWQDIVFYEKIAKQLEAQTGIKANAVKQLVDEGKRKIRRHTRDYFFDPGESVFADKGDSVIFKYPLPESIKTLEDAEEYFEEYELVPYRPTYYDCTGQRFTGWYKIFQKPDGRFWVYHQIDMDV